MNEMLYMQNIILYSLTCLQEEDQVVHLWKFLCTSLHRGSCQPQHPQWVRLWRVQKRRSLWRNGLTMVIQAVHTLTKHHEYLSSCSVPCEHDIVTSSVHLFQWITTLTSSSICPEVTWTSASTLTPNPVIFLTCFLTVEQVVNVQRNMFWCFVFHDYIYSLLL